MTERRELGLIWAQARGRVIGRDGELPWYLPEDLAHFKQITAGATVLMGRRTWDSLPGRFRPLPGRRNVVLTRSPGWRAQGAESAPTVREAVDLAGTDPVWVIGGGELYRATIDLATRLEVTEIDLAVAGDTLAPEVDANWTGEPDAWLTSVTGCRYRFRRMRRSGLGERPAEAVTEGVRGRVLEGPTSR